MWESEGDNAHDLHPEEHWLRVGAGMEGQDLVIRLHFGNKGLDSTAPSIDRAAWLSLHNAAVTSLASFLSAMGAIYGTWWSGYVAACDTAGVTGNDRPELITRAFFRRALDFGL